MLIKDPGRSGERREKERRVDDAGKKEVAGGGWYVFEKEDGV